MSNDLQPRATPWEDEPERLAHAHKLPAMRALVAAVARECEEFETHFFAMAAARWLGAAQGKQLDTLGAVLGEDRKGRTDGRYTVALRLCIRARRSHGKVRDILDILDLLGYDYSYREHYPAGFRVEVFGADAVEVPAWVFKARGGGVGASVVFALARATTWRAEPVAGPATAGNVYASVTNRAMGFPIASVRRV